MTDGHTCIMIGGECDDGELGSEYIGGGSLECD